MILVVEKFDRHQKLDALYFSSRAMRQRLYNILYLYLQSMKQIPNSNNEKYITTITAHSIRTTQNNEKQFTNRWQTLHFSFNPRTAIHSYSRRDSRYLQAKKHSCVQIPCDVRCRQATRLTAQSIREF